jgi:hypothetical protein
MSAILSSRRETRSRIISSLSVRIHRRPRPRPQGGHPPKRPQSTTDARDSGPSGHRRVVVVVLGRMLMLLLLLLLHPPMLEVGRWGYCDGTGGARGGGGRADPRGCPGAIVRGSRCSRVDVVGALPRGVHRQVDHARGDQGPESVHPPLLLLLLPPDGGGGAAAAASADGGGASAAAAEESSVVSSSICARIRPLRAMRLATSPSSSRPRDRRRSAASCPSSSRTWCSSTTSLTPAMGCWPR